MKSLLECAKAAAQAAGEHAMKNFDRRREVVETLEHDVKLKLDIECQAVAESVIRDTFPDHGVLGEEGSSVRHDQPRWIIDPIDGTVNFQHGLYQWCNSVAVEQNGEVVAGAVAVPMLHELFYAEAGCPAFRNDEEIHVSDIATLKEAMVVTGLSKYSNDPVHMPKFEVVKQLALKAQKVRTMGAAALDVCNVACGRVDGHVETGIYLWDIAAAGLIAKQAGGHSEVIEVTPSNKLKYVCSNGLIHEELKEVFLSVKTNIV